ncbi:hypothetical protein CSUB01_04044 [Colletotrichum sublineola]|uniref:Uncharacterized protein n=1 Tax=Colletotrichum sublineola TaxID=1173701 RepID=A0A066XD71_COLSU|nr:hypothetical protein CSUB01_04044 [Colletotrichum sublineola]
MTHEWAQPEARRTCQDRIGIGFRGVECHAPPEFLWACLTLLKQSQGPATSLYVLLSLRFPTNDINVAFVFRRPTIHGLSRLLFSRPPLRHTPVSCRHPVGTACPHLTESPWRPPNVRCTSSCQVPAPTGTASDVVTATAHRRWATTAREAFLKACPPVPSCSAFTSPSSASTPDRNATSPILPTNVFCPAYPWRPPNAVLEAKQSSPLSRSRVSNQPSATHKPRGWQPATSVPPASATSTASTYATSQPNPNDAEPVTRPLSNTGACLSWHCYDGSQIGITLLKFALVPIPQTRLHQAKDNHNDRKHAAPDENLRHHRLRVTYVMVGLSRQKTLACGKQHSIHCVKSLMADDEPGRGLRHFRPHILSTPRESWQYARPPLFRLLKDSSMEPVP